MYEPVSIDEMRPQLLTLDTVRETLAQTEPMEEFTFSAGPGVRFRLGEGWAAESEDGEEEPDPYAPVDAFVCTADVEAGGKEYQLTHQAVLQAGAACGIPRGYQQRTPAALLEPHLNYWFSGGFGERDFKLLVMGGTTALGITRATVSPWSNLRLLTSVLEGIEAKYGQGEVLADYKFHHDLERTDLRLVIPGEHRTITGTAEADDTWSAGIQFKNSLIGLKPTEIDGYLFRWWCTNGAIDTLATSGGFSLRGGGDPDEVFEWARKSGEEVLGGLEQSFDDVQRLTTIPVTGDATMVLRDLFAQYNIPGRERDRVIANMADTDEMTMYGLMQAVTEAANMRDLQPRAVEQLLTMGGHTLHAATGRCTQTHPCRRLLPAGYDPPPAD